MTKKTNIIYDFPPQAQLNSNVQNNATEGSTDEKGNNEVTVVVKQANAECLGKIITEWLNKI